jgi:hypothetical protein
VKPEYHKGADARKNFEETMTKLFRAPKPAKPEKQPKKKAAPEEKKN